MRNAISTSVLNAIRPFDKLDLYDPIIVVGLNARALSALYISCPDGFECDVYFNYDPDPYLRVSWWHGMTGVGDEIMFRFNPLRIEESINDLYKAYDRAMAII